jgi:hypothetical protein
MAKKLKNIMTQAELEQFEIKKTNSFSVVYVDIDDKRIFYQKVDEHSEKYKKINPLQALQVSSANASKQYSL